eukprot:357723-Chlamydomonas_euryale.AAC.24
MLLSAACLDVALLMREPERILRLKMQRADSDLELKTHVHQLSTVGHTTVGHTPMAVGPLMVAHTI